MNNKVSSETAGTYRDRRARWFIGRITGGRHYGLLKCANER